jgi:ribonuclease HII
MARDSLGPEGPEVRRLPPAAVERLMPARSAGLALEREFWDAGYPLLAGVDEAGRGAWAGPLVAAAVVFPSEDVALSPLLGRVDDSKRMAPAIREALLPEIQALALGIGIGWVGADELDEVGLGAANRLAMMRAVAGLPLQPSYLLIDYLTLPAISCHQRGIPHGDALSLSIAAASVVAKVTRDRWMVSQDASYSGYGFARHKGYGTGLHREALARLGPCLLHRRSFEPVKRIG